MGVVLKMLGLLVVICCFACVGFVILELFDWCFALILRFIVGSLALFGCFVWLLVCLRIGCLVLWD